MNPEQYYSIKLLVEKQLDTFYPTSTSTVISENLHQKSYIQTANCINSIKDWRTKGFDHYISWQYATYLYFLSRNVYLEDSDTKLPTRLFLLNKALNAFELYYEIELPEFFFLSHTVGIVFGKANYSNYCVFHQGCTIGRNGDDRPTLEEGVILFPNSSVIGKCLIKSNTVITPGVQIVNQDTPGNCLVFSGNNGKPIFKEISECFAKRYFDF